MTPSPPLPQPSARQSARSLSTAQPLPPTNHYPADRVRSQPQARPAEQSQAQHLLTWVLSGYAKRPSRSHAETSADRTQGLAAIRPSPQRRGRAAREGLADSDSSPRNHPRQLTSSQIHCDKAPEISQPTEWLTISHSVTSSTAPATPRPARILPTLNLPGVNWPNNFYRGPDRTASFLSERPRLVSQPTLLPGDHIAQPVAHMATELRIARPGPLAGPLSRRLDRNTVSLGELLTTNPPVRVDLFHSETLPS